MENNNVNPDKRRITLVNRHPQMEQRMWDLTPEAASRVILVDSFTLLRYSVTGTMSNVDADVERVILDRSSSASDYLSLIAELTRDFQGDVMMIRDDESGFLSCTGRGGDRVLYALSSEDVRFYLETHGLAEVGSAAPSAAREFQLLRFRARTAVA